MRQLRGTSAALLLLGLLASTAAASIDAEASADPLPTVTLSVDQPPGPFLHHTVATVHWTYTSGTVDAEQDWVSVWWEPFAATYVQYANVTSSTGSATFELLNARHAYVFRFYRGNTSVAEAADRAVPDATYPMGARVVLSGTDANEVSVMWTSNRSLGMNTVVQYGFSRDSLTLTQAVSKSLTYTAQELNDKLQLPPIAKRTEPFDGIGLRRLRCGWGTCYNDFTANELWVEPGLQHVAYLKDLAPATTYFYRVGEVDGHMSEIRRFTTKASPNPNTSISVMYVADAGAGYAVGGFAGGAADNDCPIPPVFEPDGAKFVWEAIRQDPLTRFDTASIMNGDVSYARGWPYLWDLFHNETEDVFGQLPVMLAFGNHEMDYGHLPFSLTAGGDSGGECGIATGRRFDLNEERPWFYVADGPAFFVVLSSEHDPVRQAQWMKHVAFKAFDRAVTPWLIVMFHRPIYESNTWAGEALQGLMRDQYADLFVRAGVDLVLTGHAHYYERLCAISSGSCNTWGYRDVWTQFENVVMSSDISRCSFDGHTNDTWACRAECARAQPGASLGNANCTGTIFDEESKKCTLLTCAQPYALTSKDRRSVWSLEKQPGASPIYIVDGTAGGVHVPVSTPYSPLTVYKDFLSWGYSRLNINGTALTWRHYHIDGSIVDQTTLYR